MIQPISILITQAITKPHAATVIHGTVHVLKPCQNSWLCNEHSKRENCHSELLVCMHVYVCLKVKKWCIFYTKCLNFSFFYYGLFLSPRLIFLWKNQLEISELLIVQCYPMLKPWLAKLIAILSTDQVVVTYVNTVYIKDIIRWEPEGHY